MSSSTSSRRMKRGHTKMITVSQVEESRRQQALFQACNTLIQTACDAAPTTEKAFLTELGAIWVLVLLAQSQPLGSVNGKPISSILKNFIGKLEK